MVIPSKNRALMVDAEDNNSVCVSDMGQPKLTANHGVLLKVICSGVCSSDVNTYRNAPSTLVSGLPLGHEVVGEVTHLGSAVKKLQLGDIVIVPFNVACGMCENCLRQSTHLCLRANKEMPGATYGHASLDSGWHGGQAEYFFAPWADFNCVKLPDKRLAMQHIFDLTLVTDVLPTALHAAKMAKVSAGKTVFIAGAGPVGIAAAKICRELLGAARVIVGDMNSARLVMLHEMGVDAVDLSRESNLSTALEHILGYPRVDCVLECVGYVFYWMFFRYFFLKKKVLSRYEQFATTSMQIEQEKLLDYWCQLVNICEFDGKIHVTGTFCEKKKKRNKNFFKSCFL